MLCNLATDLRHSFNAAVDFHAMTEMTRKEYIYRQRFDFESGGHIDNLKIVYHISGDGQGAGQGNKVIWICHALTANSDPSEWWPELVGPGKLIDTDRYTVVCANMLCSAYGSSGPSSEKDCVSGENGKDRYYFDFPKVTVRDIVKAEILLRKHLGISRIDLLVGGSIGGFQAIEWAIMEPDTVAAAAFIACGPRVTPWLTANNEAQRMAIESDASFRRAENLKGGETGLRAARAMALISYRSYEGYNLTQQETDADTVFAGRAASYERYQGKKLSDRFDAYSYYYLTCTIDSHNVGRGRGGVAEALGGIRARTIVIGIDSDRLFPTCEQKEIANCIPGAEYHEITSRFGHDGFLLEYGQISEILGPVLNDNNNQINRICRY